eukprot:gene2957-5758_t
MLARNAHGCTITIITAFIMFSGIFCDRVAALSIMFRPAWADEVENATLSRWFEFVQAGRKLGPYSPYFLHDLVLQNVACNQVNPLGPPCNASAPTNSKQAKGNYSMQYGSLFLDALEKLQPHLSIFDTVYIGSMWLDGWNSSNFTSNTVAANQQADVAAKYLQHFDRQNLAWYITMEGPLDAITFDHQRVEGMVDFLNKSINALKRVRDLPILWSPYWQASYDSYNVSSIAQIKSGMVRLFCGISHDISVHFQDCLAWTCDGHTVPFYELLVDVTKECPNLREVKVNMEMFAEHRNNGKRGENNGALIVTADSHEIAERMLCYEKNNVEIGACWALPHWFSLFSQANETVFHPY